MYKPKFDIGMYVHWEGGIGIIKDEGIHDRVYTLKVLEGEGIGDIILVEEETILPLTPIEIAQYRMDTEC